MIFTVNNLIDSLAGMLKSQYEYPVYASPNQQGTKYPCFFITQMLSDIEGQLGKRFLRDLGLDIVFVQQRNRINGYQEIREIAEFLDENLDSFIYSDGTDAVKIRTCEREWNIEDDELHYKFHIKQRVSVDKKTVYMEKMEVLNGRIESG